MPASVAYKLNEFDKLFNFLYILYTHIYETCKEYMYYFHIYEMVTKPLLQLPTSKNG